MFQKVASPYHGQPAAWCSCRLGIWVLASLRLLLSDLHFPHRPRAYFRDKNKQKRKIRFSDPVMRWVQSSQGGLTGLHHTHSCDPSSERGLGHLNINKYFLDCKQDDRPVNYDTENGKINVGCSLPRVKMFSEHSAYEFAKASKVPGTGGVTKQTENSALTGHSVTFTPSFRVTDSGSESKGRR